MRLLSLPEINSVAGGDGSSVNISTPVGVNIQVSANANSTVTVSFWNTGNGNLIGSWNSGVAVTCTAVGLGAGVMSLGFTGGNVPVAGLVADAVNAGCQAYINSTLPPPTYSGDDGDG